MTVKIELRKIKTIASMSEETHCFTADLIVDGQLWGQISNRGQGGSDDFAGVGGRNWTHLKALDERIAAEYPPHDLTNIGCPGETMPESLECICGELVNEYLAAQQLTRMMKTKVVFTEPNEPGLYTIKSPSPAVIMAFAEKVKEKKPGRVVLNLLPQDEALALFRKVG